MHSAPEDTVRLKHPRWFARCANASTSFKTFVEVTCTAAPRMASYTLIVLRPQFATSFRCFHFAIPFLLAPNLPRPPASRSRLRAARLPLPWSSPPRTGHVTVLKILLNTLRQSVPVHF